MDWGSVFCPPPVRGGQVGPDMKLNGFQFCSIALHEISEIFYYADMFRLNSYKAIGKMLEIARFHMTSRWPYCCSKTIKRRPCWCSKPILWELNSFLMLTLSFVPINLHRCWPREWKRYSMRFLYAVINHDKLGYGAVCRNLTYYFAFLKKKCIVNWL